MFTKQNMKWPTNMSFIYTIILVLLNSQNNKIPKANKIPKWNLLKLLSIYEIKTNVLVIINIYAIKINWMLELVRMFGLAANMKIMNKLETPTNKYCGSARKPSIQKQTNKQTFLFLFHFCSREFWSQNYFCYGYVTS